MTLEQAFQLTSKLISIYLVLSGLELFIGFRRGLVQSIWSYENLRQDLELGVPLPNYLIKKIFDERWFQWICLFQTLVATFNFWNPNFVLLLVLFITHLSICIRFRGTFNGGSDMMALVVLSGSLIYIHTDKLQVQKLGMIYIAIHTVYSYFKAGVVKVIHRDWITGRALSVFLGRSVFFDIKKISTLLDGKNFISWIACWGVLIFELAAIVLPFFRSYIWSYAITAILFHFIVFILFGLNRFFWVWLSAWPATLFAFSIM